VSARQRRKRDKRRRHAAGRATAKRRIVSGTGLGVAAALGASATAHAADFTVNAGGDAGDGTCDAAPGGCTLRDALDDAAANDNAPTVDQILFDSGVTGTITLNGTQLPTVDEPLYIDGPGAGTLTVSGNDASRILYIAPPAGDDVTVSGLTLDRGSAGAGGGPPFGGAVYSGAADLTIKDSTISRSASGSLFAGVGGGVAAFGPSLTVQDSRIVNNVAGGKYSSGGGLNSASEVTTIERSTISGNAVDANDAAGGGFAIKYGGPSGAGTTTIEDSTISGNTATGADTAAGGGVGSKYGPPGSGTGTITIDRSTISGNSVSAPAASGGGILAIGPGATTVQDSTISGNVADTAGGGMYSVSREPDPVIANTIVADNSAPTAPDLGSPDDTFQTAFSLIEHPAGAPLNATVADSNIIGVDPQLGGLRSNGGPTETRALAADSPAVDQGSSPHATDQRGMLRPVNAGLADSALPEANCADIGAFELELASGGAGPGCGPPNTQITKAPKEQVRLKKDKKTRKAIFEFTSSDPGSTFECKFDAGPFEPCAPPDAEKVKKGMHTFAVRATDEEGQVDPTAATYDWRVRRPKNK
jgi:hypothetical protein